MAASPEPKPDVTYRAPVGCVDLQAFDDDGNSYEIQACHDCLPWHAEVVIVEGNVLVREWHAVCGPQFQELTLSSLRELPHRRIQRHLRHPVHDAAAHRRLQGLPKRDPSSRPRPRRAD